MEDRIQALWEQMNRGIPSSSSSNKNNKNNKNNNTKRSFSSANSPPPRKLSDNWIMNLGLIPKANSAASLTVISDQDQRIASLWAQMNKPFPNLPLKPSPTPHSAPLHSTSQPKSENWMTYLGMSTKQPESAAHVTPHKEQADMDSGDNDEPRKLAAAAAAALTAVKDAAAVASTRGKVEIKEFREFAGQEIEVREFVDANSKEAAEKAKAHATSAVDAVLEQIKKKPKLSVLDKTKKDWGEFKEENKGLEDELDAYKKSSNQYLDKVSFLERADYREFERERDARLALQARRRPDMHEDP